MLFIYIFVYERRIRYLLAELEVALDLTAFEEFVYLCSTIVKHNFPFISLGGGGLNTKEFVN
jgi:hypothetical protein